MSPMVLFGKELGQGVFVKVLKWGFGKELIFDHKKISSLLVQ